MIPCFICGRNTDGGWIKGFPPAPDSQKLGLCEIHNTTPNREKVDIAWHDYLLAALSDLNSNNAYRAKARPQLLSIFFNGGGSISVPCLSFSTPNPEVLKVLTPENEAVYFPLRQVRHYALAPLPVQTAPSGAAPEAETMPDPALPKAEEKTFAEKPAAALPETPVKTPAALPETPAETPLARPETPDDTPAEAETRQGTASGQAAIAL